MNQRGNGGFPGSGPLIIEGQAIHLPDETAVPGQPDYTSALRTGLDLVAGLHGKLLELDALLLTGRPAEIVEAAALVETSLKAAAPAFERIAAVVEQLGAGNLKSAALQLREAEQPDAAHLAEALRLALKRFATRSVQANRRAQHLTRGLNTALRSLQALGVHESGRLIAEA